MSILAAGSATCRAGSTRGADGGTGFSWSTAHDLAWSAGEPLSTMSKGLEAAVGSVLAKELRAVVPLPVVDTAAMDGFAVAGGGPWSVVGHVRAGDPSPGDLAPGQCLEVATGAVLPSTADAVVPYERAARNGSRVSGSSPAGQHVRRRGEDCAGGQLLVPAGQQVTPAVAGLAAGVGHDALEVVRAPVVGCLITGSEVITAGSPSAGEVRDAIGPILPGLTTDAGGVIGEVLRLRDEETELEAAIDAAACDVLVVSGGSSAGPADHLRRVLTRCAATVLVGGVACRPGHPQLLARLPDGRWVVGLPGNPYAALAAAMTILVPLLSTLAGHARPTPSIGRLAVPVTPHPHDTRLVPVRRAHGRLEPVGHDRSANLWGAALADALAVISPGDPTPCVQLLGLPGATIAAPARARRR